MAATRYDSAGNTITRTLGLGVSAATHRGFAPQVKAREQVALFYCAFIHVSDPVSLTATSEKNSWNGPPSAVPRWSVEISRGPAFL